MFAKLLLAVLIILEKISFFLVIFSLIFAGTEYIILRKMSYYYYKNGPFVTKLTLKSMPDKNKIINRLYSDKGREIFSTKQAQNFILLSFNPSFKWYGMKEFPSQRIVINFSESISESEVCFEIRPFYSIFLLPFFLTFYFIFGIIIPNQYTSILMKLFEIIIVCFIGFALFIPLRPKFNSINQLINFIKN